MTAGIHHCTGDVAAIIDADLQDPPGSDSGHDPYL